jgi:hypothetical protein
MHSFKNILNAFEPISLEQMDNVKLLNRSDTKFLFRIELLEEILEKLKDYFFVLDVNGIRENNYETLYYDTSDFKFYNDHLRGKANRIKVRHRIYSDSGLQFFEIKKKNNKGRTIKERIKLSEIYYILKGRPDEYLYEKTQIKGEDLKPILWGNYTRITLVNKTQPERLTIDINLHFKNNQKEYSIPDIVIAELKQDFNHRSIFKEIMMQYRIKEVSISKYCFGVINLYNNIKCNGFKTKILTLNKLIYAKN